MDNKQISTDKSETAGRVDHLALLAAGHDKLAFAELLSVFQPYIAVTARSFKLPASEYDDLSEIGRIALYRAVLTHNASRASFVAYARVCIKNAMISFVRSYQSRNQYIGPSLDDEDIPEAPDPSASLPEDRLVIDEFLEEVKKAISEALSESERTVMTYKLEGLGVAEISVLTGKDAKSVENTLFRARKKLRGALSSPL